MLAVFYAKVLGPQSSSFLCPGKLTYILNHKSWRWIFFDDFPFNLVILRFQPGVYAMLKIGSSIHEPFEFAPPESTSRVSAKRRAPKRSLHQGIYNHSQGLTKTFEKKKAWNFGTRTEKTHGYTWNLFLDNFFERLSFPQLFVLLDVAKSLISSVPLNGQLSRQQL